MTISEEIKLGHFERLLWLYRRYLATRKKQGMWAPEAARAAADFWITYVRISEIGLADEWQKFYENARKEARINVKKRAKAE